MKVRQMLNELLEWGRSERPVDIAVQAVEQSRGEMMVRIFNSEQGVKDTQGRGVGSYSNAYAKRREAKGLQSKVVDFTYSESLFRSIKTARANKEVLIAVPNAAERQKIDWLEQQYRKNQNKRNRSIFNLSEKEREDAKKVIKKNISLDVQEIIQKYSK